MIRISRIRFIRRRRVVYMPVEEELELAMIFKELVEAKGYKCSVRLE